MDKKTVITLLNNQVLLDLIPLEEESLIKLSEDAKKSAGKCKFVVTGWDDKVEGLQIGDHVIPINMTFVAKFKYSDKDFYIIDADKIGCIIREVEQCLNPPAK